MSPVILIVCYSNNIFWSCLTTWLNFIPKRHLWKKNFQETLQTFTTNFSSQVFFIEMPPLKVVMFGYSVFSRKRICRRECRGKPRERIGVNRCEISETFIFNLELSNSILFLLTRAKNIAQSTFFASLQGPSFSQSCLSVAKESAIYISVRVFTPVEAVVLRI